MKQGFTALVAAIASGSAHADFTNTVPEPGSFELLAIAAVVAVVVAVRNRRK